MCVWASDFQYNTVRNRDGAGGRRRAEVARADWANRPRCGEGGGTAVTAGEACACVFARMRVCARERDCVCIGARVDVCACAHTQTHTQGNDKTYNGFHGSESVDAAHREIRLVFDN